MDNIILLQSIQDWHFILLVRPITTARKRSLGQGNMFTGVYLSTGGVPAPGEGSGSGVGACSGGCLLWGCLVPGRYLFWGVPAPRGCLLPGVAWWRPPRKLLLRAVRILLECILVFYSITALFLKDFFFVTMIYLRLSNSKLLNLLYCLVNCYVLRVLRVTSKTFMLQ